MLGSRAIGGYTEPKCPFFAIKHMLFCRTIGTCSIAACAQGWSEAGMGCAFGLLQPPS